MMLGAFAKEVQNANATVDLGLYVDYRDTALAIKAKRYDDALCATELGASGRYDDLKACLTTKDCGPAIKEQLRKVAPEVLGEAPMRFTYYRSQNGIRSCERVP